MRLYPNPMGVGVFSETLVIHNAAEVEQQSSRAERPRASRRVRTTLWLLVAASACGLVLALFGAYQTLLAQHAGLARLSACRINEWISCEKALSSSAAVVFGVPVAWLGFLYYLWMALYAGLAARQSDGARERLNALLWLSAAAMAVSLYKASELIFSLRVLCPVCVGMHVLSASILLGVILAVRQCRKDETPSKKSRNRLEPASTPRGRAVLSAAYAGGFILAGMSAAKIALPFWLGLNAIDIEAEVAKHFEQKPQRMEIHPFAPVWGNPSGRVRMAVYSDFQCPHCKRAAFHLRRLLEEFKEEISLAFMNFPLDRKINPSLPNAPHEQAGLAARAAVCAQSHGGFWEFHDQLFERQEDLSLDFILNLAEQQGWEREAFAKELELRATYLRVIAEIQYASRVHINSTPTVIINGRPLQYWEHPEILRRVVREEIRAGR
jgi:uncharacterized membrane protein/predicted DsbA family dithiol-disulfide isomerase